MRARGHDRFDYICWPASVHGDTAGWASHGVADFNKTQHQSEMEPHARFHVVWQISSYAGFAADAGADLVARASSGFVSAALPRSMRVACRYGGG